jgi:hypothetical protein
MWVELCIDDTCRENRRLSSALHVIECREICEHVSEWMCEWVGGSVFVHVCACVCVCACACARVCAWEWLYMGVCVWMSVCVFVKRQEEGGRFW